MGEKTAKILEEILRLSTYDEETKTYYLSKEASKILNSNQTQKNIIKRTLIDLGINIEYSNKVLPKIKGIELFSKYNDIKYQIDNTFDLEKKYKLEILRIDIRNQIAESNFELIKIIIDRRFNKINLDLTNYIIEIEDLYQLGYELLIEYIDKHYLEKDKMFTEITSLIILHLENKLFTELCSSSYSKKDLIKLKNILELKENIDIKELSTELNIKEERIKELLTLYNIINPTNIDEIENSKIIEQDNIEDIYINKEKQLYLERLINLIQNDTQKRILTLLYGLNGEKKHTYKETVNLIGCSEKNLIEKRKIAITHLTNPILIKYIKQIIDINSTIPLNYEDIYKLSTSELKNIKKLELFLIKQLDIKHLLHLIDKLNPQFKEALLISLGYQDKSEHYYKNAASFHLEKEYALIYLRKRITELYINNGKNEELKDYFDYLMHYYLNKPLIKRRVK